MGTTRADLHVLEHLLSLSAVSHFSDCEKAYIEASIRYSGWTKVSFMGVLTTWCPEIGLGPLSEH
jgi:hypothetical protein